MYVLNLTSLLLPGLPSMDVTAMVVCLLLTWVLAAGVEMSARMNNILNLINACAWALFLIASICLSDSENVNKKAAKDSSLSVSGVRLVFVPLYMHIGNLALVQSL